MALFDTMNPALAQNGQGAPNVQQNLSPPGIFSGFGNTPSNLAGGLQQFMNPQFMAMLQLMQRGTAPGAAPAGAPGAAPAGAPGPVPGVGMTTPAGAVPSQMAGAAPPQQGYPTGNLASGLNAFLRR
jgi:hypothetical protein